MPQHLEPSPPDPDQLRFAIVVSRFNEPVTTRLLEGALLAFREQGVPDDNLTVAWVPGAFELPLTSRWLAQTGRYAAIVALGAVIRGETSHYDHVCEQAAAGLMQVGLEQSLPVIFGVLTTENEEQALARAGGDGGTKKGNKGADAALAALAMCGFKREIEER